MTASPSSTNQCTNGNKYGVGPISSVPSKPKLRLVSAQGQLQIYSSPYRGSFSVVMSEALRSAGLGSKVLIAQFLKGGVNQGPSQTIKLCGNLEWLRPNVCGCINEKLKANLPKSEEFSNNAKSVQEIWRVCKEHLNKNTLDKLVLDEIGLAIEFGFISEEDLIRSIENRHDSVDVIVTGPSIPTKLFSIADQVTQLRRTK